MNCGTHCRNCRNNSNSRNHGMRLHARTRRNLRNRIEIPPAIVREIRLQFGQIQGLKVRGKNFSSCLLRTEKPDLCRNQSTQILPSRGKRSNRRLRYAETEMSENGKTQRQTATVRHPNRKAGWKSLFQRSNDRIMERDGTMPRNSCGSVHKRKNDHYGKSCRSCFKFSSHFRLPCEGTLRIVRIAATRESK